MSKKLIVLVLVLVLVLAACSDPSTPTGTTPADPGAAAPPAPEAGDDGLRPVRLASHNAVVEGNSFRIRYELDIQEAASAAADHGFAVSYASFVANWDAALEVQQLQNSINEGYDFILVNPVSVTGLDPVIERAREAGILYINANNIYISPGAGVLNVGSNQFEQGYLTAREAGRVLGPGARVIMMAAREGNAASELRQRGFEAGIEAEQLVVVHESFHDWNYTQATERMLEILNAGVDFDGILVSQNANALIDAFEITGTPLPRFIGYHDGGNFMLQMIELNRDERVIDFMMLSNSPGVGGTALNIGLNQMLGRELRADLPYWSDIWDDVIALLLPNSIWMTYDDSWDGRTIFEWEDEARRLGSDVPTHWWTFEDAGNHFFY